MKSDSPSPLDHLRDPLADPVLDRRRVRLGLMLVGTGLMHFLAPGPVRRIVPGWFPWPDGAVAVSGAAEILSGSLTAHPRTQRLGGALATGTLVAVYPANIQMALDASCGGRGGAREGASGPTGRLALMALWLRLPLQFPMISTALRVARGR